MNTRGKQLREKSEKLLNDSNAFMSKTAIVTTTIRLPRFLEGVCENVVTHKHEDVSCIVVGDEKTPAETSAFCEALSKKFGVPIFYLDIPAQERALAAYPELLTLVPHNSGVRKLLGNFIAYRDGCETLIMIDDDNFATDIDLVGFHGIVNNSPELEYVETDTGWFNVYESLVEERSIPFFPRGYPWGERKRVPTKIRKQKRALKIAVNSGLVLEDPDVDAITRLFWPIRVLGMAPGWGPNFALAPGTWAPFNNQNTSLSREAIPIHFTPAAGGRNSDIWTSYIMTRVIEHRGDAVSFGYPLVKQLRNPHDLWKDLDDELLNDRTSDQFVALVRSTPLTEKTYLSSLGELLEKMLAQLPALAGLSEGGTKMIGDFLREYQMWQRVCARAEKSFVAARV